MESKKALLILDIFSPFNTLYFSKADFHHRLSLTIRISLTIRLSLTIKLLLTVRLSLTVRLLLTIRLSLTIISVLLFSLRLGYDNSECN